MTNSVSRLMYSLAETQIILSCRIWHRMRFRCFLMICFTYVTVPLIDCLLCAAARYTCVVGEAHYLKGYLLLTVVRGEVEKRRFRKLVTIKITINRLLLLCCYHFVRIRW